MSATTVRLLEAASEAVGGQRMLADRLGVAETLLLKFMTDRLPLPDPLLLRAVDIILADRESRFLVAPTGVARAGETLRED